MTWSVGFGGEDRGSICHYLHLYDMIFKLNQLTSNAIAFHVCSENHLLTSRDTSFTCNSEMLKFSCWAFLLETFWITAQRLGCTLCCLTGESVGHAKTKLHLPKLLQEHLPHFIVCRNHPGGWEKADSDLVSLELRVGFCISNQPPGDVSVACLLTTLWSRCSRIQCSVGEVGLMNFYFPSFIGM